MIVQLGYATRINGQFVFIAALFLKNVPVGVEWIAND
jgi:hypothetical protein